MKSNGERFQFALNLFENNDFDIKSLAKLKNEILAFEFKERGNEAFKRKKFNKALNFYNKAVVCAPFFIGKYSCRKSIYIFGFCNYFNEYYDKENRLHIAIVLN